MAADTPGRDPAAAPGHASPVSYFVVWVALLLLTATTVIAAFVPLPGWLHTPVALLIAAVKATLIVIVFMHAREGGRLVWAVILSAVLFLGIMLAHTLADYWSRPLDLEVRDPPARSR